MTLWVQTLGALQEHRVQSWEMRHVLTKHQAMVSRPRSEGYGLCAGRLATGGGIPTGRCWMGERARMGLAFLVWDQASRGMEAGKGWLCPGTSKQEGPRTSLASISGWRGSFLSEASRGFGGRRLCNPLSKPAVSTAALLLAPSHAELSLKIEG